MPREADAKKYPELAHVLRHMGDNFATWRKRSGLSLPKMASLFRMDEKTIRRLEKGEAGPSLICCMWAARRLRLDLHQLWAEKTPALEVDLELEFKKDRLAGAQRDFEEKAPAALESGPRKRVKRHG